MSRVSLYMSGKYDDEIIEEDDNIIVIKYCGQTSGRRDYLIIPDALLFCKQNNKYKLLGCVISVDSIEVENNINVYKLVVQKEKNIQQLFRVKNDICDYFGWKKLNRFEQTHGIIQHN